MAFLNTYTKSESYSYNSSLKIGAVIYSVGKGVAEDSIITKLDSNGTVIWEKSYFFNNYSIEFVKLTACSDALDFLILGVSANRLYLFKIDPEGAIVWQRELSTAFNFQLTKAKNFNTLIDLGDDNYVLAFTEIDDQQNIFLAIVKFSGDGILTASRMLEFADYAFELKGITSGGDKIIFYGKGFNYNEQNDRGIIIELDLELTSVLNFIDSLTLQSVDDLIYTDEVYTVRGNTFDLHTFFVQFTLSGNYLSIDLSKEYTGPVIDNLKNNKYHLFLETYDRSNAVVSKIDFQFNPEWTKNFEFVNTQWALGILCDVTEESIILNNSLQESVSGNLPPAVIGSLDLDLTSCRTSDLSLVSLVDKSSDFNLHAANYNLSELNCSFDGVSNPDISAVTSVKTIICPELENPTICEEHVQLHLFFTSTIEQIKFNNPDYLNDLSVFQELFNEFLTRFNQIVQNFTEYNFPDSLQYQVVAIQDYVDYIGGNAIENYYDEAYSAAFFILDYLSQSGNCSLENLLELSEFSSVQSANLYLQAAGSLGLDSTQGIHLRWAFREALSQHLPKGNYATTEHNFNKTDDFVKIYRAAYTPYQVHLNFEEVPAQINEIGSRKNWIYNIDGKVFHLHFRNIIKYNQVRVVHNPSTDPLGFIQSYGDALIEVETKTELSFKISANFEVLNPSNSVKVELLSVSENKLTSPKVVSLRKVYSETLINATPLISENIRSIRFKTEGSKILSLSFEFYSDFISNKKIANEWNFLGKYALTKESNVAFQRLEPQPNCLNSWLRYNDEAFVNPANYHTRWGSNDLPVVERVQNSVEKYITLSDSIDNPKAIEFHSYDDSSSVTACNLTDPNYNEDNPVYDPYIPETPDATSGIELSYLDVLLLGSLDYHTARMLGLGTLDLNPVVFNGAYIYLAEYVTFGDLDNGNGIREVQHLYCSLPTTLSDQRLPLPVDLKEPVPGVFFTSGYDDSATDAEESSESNPENYNLQAVELTTNGYSTDGKTRYYSLYAEAILDEEENAPFYYIANEFIACETTYPVFAGLEYKETTATQWKKPELSHTPYFLNIDTSGVQTEFTNETIELILPEEGQSLYTHAVKESGSLDYSSYGINWFSRATPSEVIHTVETLLKPANELLPPTNVTATLIRKESPLLLTTSFEQTLYDTTVNEDRVLVRLTFDYNHGQELINYHQKNNGVILPNYSELEDSKELFAEKIQVFFRDQIPASISGKIKELFPSSNPLLVEVTTEPYPVYSSGIDESVIPQTNPPTYNETFVPSILPGTEGNYVGSILLVNNEAFVVHEIDNTGDYPKFIVFKSDASGALLNLNTLAEPTTEVLVPQQGTMFMIVENMQSPSVWGLPNTPGFTINIDHTEVHREDEIIIKNIDCSTETHVQKFRGIYEKATIEKVLEKVYIDEYAEDFDPDTSPFEFQHLGLYKLRFPDFQLEQHSQYNLENNPRENSVEWYNGVVRLHTLSDVGNEPRKGFKVIKTENIGTTNDLILYIEDLTFPNDPDQLIGYKGKLMPDTDNTIIQKVNYYPGYKVYLYRDSDLGLTYDTVFPQGEAEVRYTVFGLRSWDFPNEFATDNLEDFYSKISVPALMFANATIEPVQPQKPTGGLFATRPDYFGKASYTFNTKYGTAEEIHKPFSVQFNRASDIQFLSAIYDNTVRGYNGNQEPILNTVQDVMQNIFLNGEEEFYVDRWNDLLSFNYPTGYFETFDDKTLPLPDNLNFIASINLFIDSHNAFYEITLPHLQPEFHLNTVVIPAGTQNSELKVWHFLKDVLLNCFVPLTEIPILYNYVKGGDYQPIPKKQVIRDRNGNLLKPLLDEEFDMAPMMKRIDPPGQQFESQFTDFGIDGASNAKYFYAAREINIQLKTSDYSEILGPISLVNTAPPIAPEIIKVIPLLENRVLGISPANQFQINAYSKSQNIAKVSIYRANNPSDALSIRTMKLVKVIDLEVANLFGQSQWIFEDDFSDLVEVPFGDPMFYKLSVSRRIRYTDKQLATIVDYAPSEASKLIITNVVENYSPLSPKLDYYSEPLNLDNELTSVVLHWEKVCYKGKYHLYKMNSQGNWVKIHELETNDQDIYLPLEQTQLGTGTLTILDADDNAVYHHFKVISENTAGMMSREEFILTVPNELNWQDIGGIGDMIISGTFYIR